MVQPGCRRCKVYDSAEVNNEILLIQEWESQQKLEHHIGSTEFKKILAAMDLSIEPPCLSFHTVSATSGFELVEKLWG
jgi:quinol monooxygenase YgiN